MYYYDNISKSSERFLIKHNEVTLNYNVFITRQENVGNTHNQKPLSVASMPASLSIHPHTVLLSLVIPNVVISKPHTLNKQ